MFANLSNPFARSASLRLSLCCVGWVTNRLPCSHETETRASWDDEVARCRMRHAADTTRAFRRMSAISVPFFPIWATLRRFGRQTSCYMQLALSLSSRQPASQLQSSSVPLRFFSFSCCSPAVVRVRPPSCSVSLDTGNHLWTNGGTDGGTDGGKDGGKDDEGEGRRAIEMERASGRAPLHLHAWLTFAQIYQEQQLRWRFYGSRCSIPVAVRPTL